MWDSISASNFTNNYITFYKSEKFNGHWSGSVTPNKSCGWFPAPPPSDEDEVYNREKYCIGYSGYDGFIPYYVERGIWKRNPILGRSNL